MNSKISEEIRNKFREKFGDEYELKKCDEDGIIAEDKCNRKMVTYCCGCVCGDWPGRFFCNFTDNHSPRCNICLGLFSQKCASATRIFCKKCKQPTCFNCFAIDSDDTECQECYND